MAISALLPPATHLFPPTLGAYDAVVAASAVQHELKATVAALAAAGSPPAIVALVLERLDAASIALEQAIAAWMAGFPC